MPHPLHSKPWSRRAILAAGAAGAGLALTPRVFGSSLGISPAPLTPELEEGPFYVASERIRSDLRESEAGLPLALQIAVIHAATGKPVAGAAVDIWHCNAAGIYSGYTKAKLGPPRDGGMHPPEEGDFAGGPPPDAPEGPPPRGGPMHGEPPPIGQTDQLSFLRGVQVTGADGRVAFQTIYPGWYSGRDIHIHLKVHESGHASSRGYQGGHVCHTGQLAFPDELTDEVAKLAPYASQGERRTRLADDPVFQGEAAAETMLSLASVQPGHLAAGMRGTIVVAIDPKATPRPAGVRRARA